MTTSLRHRKSNTFLRKFDTDIRLFHIEPCKIPKYKWSSYFASIFKRSKSKQNTNDINNNNNNKNDLSPYNNTFMDHQQVALDTKSEFEQDDHSSTKESMVYHQYIATLPSSPVSSLSPPPKHTMIIHRQHKSKSLMPIDISSYSKSSSTPIPKTYSSTPTLTITDTNNNNKVQSVTSSSPFVPASSSPSTVTAIPRQYIPARSPILRLSLDFEHHHHHLNQFNHSRQSSAQSNDESIDLNYSHNINNNKICKKNILTTQNINDQEQGSITPPSLSSSNLIERRRQRNSLLLWKGPGILDLDHRSSFIDEGEEEEKGKEINELMMDFQQLDQQQQHHHELDLSFSTTASTTFDHHHHHQKNNQIGKEKAHYDAIVASTLFHHRSSQEEQQQQRLKHQSLFIPSNNHHYPNSVTSSSIAPTIAFNPSPLNLPIYSKDTDQSLKHNDINNNTNNNKKQLIGLLDTPPSSAQLIDPNLSFSHLPSSPHSMISNELDSHL
ncbi:hypothetical protein BJ944DRAFT_252205 [Cunninghamella echinulata]|nr:hypothetical protein BJ944DRAFT_252205 [Cunninghamella echinulata]